MFYSCLTLNPRSRDARRDLADVYQLHRTLLRAFPDAFAGGSGHVLWRVETERHTGECSVLVQSEKEPRWQAVLEAFPAYLSLNDEHIPGLQVKPLPNWRLIVGQVLAFRLRANPTVKRDNRRHGVLTEAEQIGWLDRKGAAGGFTVVGVRVITEQSRVSGGSKALKFHSVLFEGTLRVTDTVLLAETLRHGVGSGKAFGFGLLSLARTEPWTA